MSKFQKKGAKEYHDWKAGKRLTRKEAILAFCWDCNGNHIVGPDGTIDCHGKTNCPLYAYFPYIGL